jgi:transposase
MVAKAGNQTGTSGLIRGTQRRVTIKMPGVGPMTASAMVAAIGKGAAFARGRDFGA